MRTLDPRALRRARIAAGFKLREVAVAADVDASFISALEARRAKAAPDTGERIHNAVVRLLQGRIASSERALLELV